MGFIQLNGLQDVVEKRIVPEGRYNLLCEGAQIKHNDKTNKDNILVVLAIEGEPNAANILFNLALPHEDDEDTAKQFKLLQLKRFLTQFGISFDGGINTEAFGGARAQCNVSVKEYEGRKSNVPVLDPLPA